MTPYSCHEGRASHLPVRPFLSVCILGHSDSHCHSLSHLTQLSGPFFTQLVAVGIVIVHISVHRSSFSACIVLAHLVHEKAFRSSLLPPRQTGQRLPDWLSLGIKFGELFSNMHCFSPPAFVPTRTCEQITLQRQLLFSSLSLWLPQCGYCRQHVGPAQPRTVLLARVQQLSRLVALISITINPTQLPIWFASAFSLTVVACCAMACLANVPHTLH